MKKRSVFRATALSIALFGITASGQAAGLNLFRTYVSSTGNDANPCTVSSPCRLLPAALANVADGGEVWMLDSANYNTQTVGVTQSVKILAIPGAVGSVVAIGGPAIDASTAGTSITLRNVVIGPFPGGGGTMGIHVNGAASLTLEDSVVAGNAGDGISISSATFVRVTRSTIRDNGGNGVSVLGDGATVDIAFAKIVGNTNTGVSLAGGTGAAATISDSLLALNGNGFRVEAQSTGGSVRGVIVRSTVADNANVGIASADTSPGGASALVTVGDTSVTGSATGLAQAGPGGVLESQGNNLVRQNGTQATAHTTITSF